METRKNKKRPASMLERPCKVCGEPVGTKDPRQVVCSRACGYVGRQKPKVEAECGVCGKSVVRYEADASKRTVFACSRECQRVLAGRAGKGRTTRDMVATSLKAKNEWKRRRQRERIKKGWQGVLLRWANQKQRYYAKSWDDKLRGMIASNVHREQVSVVSQVKRKPQKKRRRRSAWIDKWNEACSEMILLFNREHRKQGHKDPWANTLLNWMTNHRKRLRIKEHRSQLKDFETF